ncbi:retrotransposon protein, putative, ty1-copia subclass [Tanacetum coccineum]|uniref:Retrotransposon protein, putative, ty1-copia subclass n=1 Tax=Tanacetum coccineum TaxID=301880 RepID=A0ABQ4X615_9ASTR
MNSDITTTTITTAYPKRRPHTVPQSAGILTRVIQVKEFGFCRWRNHILHATDDSKASLISVDFFSQQMISFAYFGAAVGVVSSYFPPFLGGGFNNICSFQKDIINMCERLKIGGGSYPPLPTQETTSAGNTPGKSSYANVIGEPSKKAVNIHTLFTPRGTRLMLLCQWSRSELLAKGTLGVKLHGVLVTAFSEDGLSDIAMKLGTPLMLDSYTSDMCLQSWGRSSYAKVMIKLWADMELKDNLVVAMPKIMREGHYTCTVRVEYEWKPPRCSCCKVFGHTQEECPKNIRLGVAKNLKKPGQTSRGVLVGPKVGFKLHKEYRPVPKKPTASPSGNKKKGVTQIIKVSNPNQIDVLNSVDNDVEFGTNGGTTNLFEDLLIDGQAILVDEAGNPLKKVECLGDYDSEDEVASVDNDMARDYDEDPYDDDMHEGQDLSQEIQAICDNLDIRGAEPSPRLTPDVVESQAMWWLASKEFFGGHIREPPTIPSPVNQHSRDDVPEYIYRHMVEQDNLLKEQKNKLNAHNLMFIQMKHDMEDALFFGEWSRANAKNIIHILCCYEAASGMKINFIKSRLFSIGVASDDVNGVAFSLGCAHDELPFIYHGLLMGKRMRFCDG